MTILFDCIRPKGKPIKGFIPPTNGKVAANPCGEISLPVDSTTSVLTYSEEQAQKVLDQIGNENWLRNFHSKLDNSKAELELAESRYPVPRNMEQEIAQFSPIWDGGK